MTTVRLRPWQREAIAAYEATNPRDFLTTATPGAGKTTFALTIASRLVASRAVDRVVVVAPTDHLRTQWADAAIRFGLTLDPTLKNSTGPVPPGVTGYVTTYAQVAGHPLLHRRRVETKRTLVILDEIHHAGDGLSWGEAVSEAFTPALRRLSLTGTPFRTRPGERIPFVTYDEDDEELLSRADYSYSYADALRDGVVRPVVFAAYSGVSRWQNSAGHVLSASLSDAASKKTEMAAWRTALSPSGKWIPHVIAAADARLTDLRDSGMPDAGGLMLATDQETARAYADLIKKITGHTPVLALSDDPQSTRKIAAYTTGTTRWLVAVRQVSEGVDIPRLGVCIWATSYRTPLFFAQAVGRVVRSRGPHEHATVFLPAVKPLLALAAEMETERNNITRVPPGKDLDTFEPIDNSEKNEPTDTIIALDAEAEFAHVLHSGRAFTSMPELTSEDEEYLGLPGLLTPEQTASLLAQRDAHLRKQANTVTHEGGRPVMSSWRDVEDLRREITGLVRQIAARRKTTPAAIHSEAKQAVPGPSTSQAGLDILLARRDWLLSRLH